MLYLIIFFFFLLVMALYSISIKIAVKKQDKSRLSRNNSNFGIYISLWAWVPSAVIFIITTLWADSIIKDHILTNYFNSSNNYPKDIIYQQILNVVNLLKTGVNLEDVVVYSAYNREEVIKTAMLYIKYKNLSYLCLALLCSTIAFLIAFLILKNINFNINFQKKIEKFIERILLLFVAIAILTTLGIISSLIIEAFKFFKEIPILKFLFGIKWYPEAAEVDLENSFGVIPLITGTLLISFVATLTATIIGVSVAVYMAEYMSSSLRKIIKPMLEILAGIPSIVYGFFAAVTFAPFLVNLFANFGIAIGYENALSAGIVMGIMLIPFISSITDDVMISLPRALREGGMAMGSMKNEVIRKVLIPAAMPGILAGILLALSRAIGETMIVVMAVSLAANLTINPLEPVTTITVQIAMLVQGDQHFNSPKTLSAFALGLLLFILTLIFNFIALKIVAKYRKKHS